MRFVRVSFQVLIVLALVGAVFISIPPAQAAGSIITVNGTADGDLSALQGNGTCDLREAIKAANMNLAVDQCPKGTATGVEFDTVRFAIPGAGMQYIHLTAQLNVTRPIYLDGSTQPGYAGAPQVQLDTNLAGTMLSFGPAAGGSTVRGLQLISNTAGVAYALQFNSSGGHRLIGNYINTNGTSSATNSSIGLALNNSSSNMIGGSTPAARNQFGGQFGIELHGGSQNTIRNNYFGLKSSGNEVLAGMSSAGTGIQIAVGTTVDSTANMIRGNVFGGYNTGVFLNGGGSTAERSVHGNIVAGNKIGVGADGSTPVPSYSGVVLSSTTGNRIGGTTAADRNVISGNTYYGVFFDNTNPASNNLVEGNYIGTDAAGTAAVNPGVGYGIYLGAGAGNKIGDSVAGSGNLISGNNTAIVTGEGSSGTIIRGNQIGTDASGMTAVPNSYGIDLYGDADLGNATVRGNNLISGNSPGFAVNVEYDSIVTIYGNRFGTNASGTVAIPNTRSLNLYSTSSTSLGGNWFGYSTGYAILIFDSATVATASQNCFTGNAWAVVNNTTTSAPFTNNWWGSATGPQHSSNPSGTGDSVSDYVNFDPWLPSVPAACMVQRLDNSGFEIDANNDKRPDSWTIAGFNAATDTRDCTVRRAGTCSLMLVGNGVMKTVTQSISQTGAINHHFTYSLWSKASGVPSGSVYRLQLKFYNGSSLLVTKTVNIPVGTHGFTKATGSFATPWVYTKVVYQITFRAASGTAWFDAAALSWFP